MIEIKDIHAGYPGAASEVLKGLSLNIAKGSFTGIIGRNGAGKSTLLKVLCGLMTHSSGSILIDGIDIRQLSKKELAKKAAFMPQNTALSFPFSVEEFVLLGRYPYMNLFKMASEKDRQAVGEVLKFTGITGLAKRNITELSGGERQKAFIAQTIVQETEIMVFDEPTSHLDIGSQNDILELLDLLNKKYGKTVIATLHDLNAAGEFCANLVLMEDGAIKNAGTPQQVLNYKDIEKVYDTTVVVKTNPISNKPYVIPVRKTVNSE